MTERDDIGIDSAADRHVEELLRDLGPDDLELVEPPADVWEGIHRSVTESGADVPGVVSLEGRRRRRSSILLGAVAAVLLLAAFGLLVVDRSGDDDVVATAVLTYDEANFDRLGAAASAEVSVVSEDGALVVRVDDAQLPEVEGEDLEIWLIRPDDEGAPAGIVSLGLVDPDDPGTFEIPSDIDPDAYAVVDISVEPRDGIETHSGRSILRGALVTA